MSSETRYPVDEGRTCIDIRVRSWQQLFDNRDPAPFRERDLDEDAADYMLGSVAEIPPRHALRLRIRVATRSEGAMPDSEIAAAVRAHFAHERTQATRRLREHVRQGQLIFVIGAIALGVLLTAAELLSRMELGRAGEIAREGLVITAWVAMWRPLEVLFYDWWPLVASRRRLDRLLRADVVVMWGASGDETHPPPR